MEEVGGLRLIPEPAAAQPSAERDWAGHLTPRRWPGMVMSHPDTFVRSVGPALIQPRDPRVTQSPNSPAVPSTSGTSAGEIVPRVVLVRQVSDVLNEMVHDDLCDVPPQNGVVPA